MYYEEQVGMGAYNFFFKIYKKGFDSERRLFVLFIFFSKNDWFIFLQMGDQWSRREDGKEDSRKKRKSDKEKLGDGRAAVGEGEGREGKTGIRGGERGGERGERRFEMIKS